MSPLIGRDAELIAAEDLLASVTEESIALIVEGEPGIGKTTLWRELLKRAGAQGIRVLSARASAAESVLAYATLADLLAQVDHAMWAGLPAAQRGALAAALLEDYDGPALPADQRAVGAALLNVLIGLAAESPVLVGIDDLQWLDRSSAAAIAFAARRMPNRLMIAATVRTDARTASQWIQLARQDAVRRIRLPPLAIADLRDVLGAQLGYPMPRPQLLRIHKTSGGNPFYAMELARELDRHDRDDHLLLPDSLTELMRARIERVDGEAARALLAVASLGEPTIGAVAAALEVSSGELIELLSAAEEQGVLTIVGQSLRFAHPLLAHAVHTCATPAQRRSTHHRLAQIVTEPELRARHLALADPAGEPETLNALDAAADVARRRGAQAAAADLLELAINRGGDTAHRRMQRARCLFDSGDMRGARDVLETAISVSAAGPDRAEARRLLAMVRLHDDSFAEASAQLAQALEDCDRDSTLQADVLTMLAFTQLNGGQAGASLETAELAVVAAERGGHRAALGRARSMRSMMRFFSGDAVDPEDLQRSAVRNDAEDDGVPVALQPSVQSALLRGWTGDYAGARDHLVQVAERCAALGEEGELMFLSFQITLLDLWRGELQLAASTADDALQRARHLGGDAALFIASALQAAVAAYQGRVLDARQHVEIALTAGAQSGYVLMTVYVVALQGFVELSLGDHDKTLDFLEQALPVVQLAPRCTELILAGFLPDAIEALLHRGRHDEAEPLVMMLEDNGARLGRSWMLAVGARSRALLSAARGDLEGAATHARTALDHHAHLDMPFEQARTLLILGRLERRLRRWRPANIALSEALSLFDRVGTPLWAAQARAEMDRGTPGRPRATGLTRAERRVAELAAEGMRTKDIATALFIAPKTVDTNLSRIYSKLGIHSRVELVRAMNGVVGENG